MHAAAIKKSRLPGTTVNFFSYRPKFLVGIRAPSASALNFALTTVGCASGVNVAWKENPQSPPPLTFSRPTENQ
jgi:hypothetical protein